MTTAEGGYRGLRALVLGAGGFIGRWVARALEREGADLHVSDRDRERARNALASAGTAGEMHEADLTVAGAVRSLIDEVDPAIVFNLAGYGVDPAERDDALAHAVNVDLVRRVGRAMLARQTPETARATLVHVGTAAEYGRAGGDLREDGPVEPTALYGETKLAGTRALADLAQAGLLSVVARIFTVYGPGEIPGRLLPSLVEAAAAGTSLDLTEGGQMRDFTYVEDVAEGLLRLGAARPPAGGVINLATGRLASVRTFVMEAAEVLGIPRDHLRFGARPDRPDEMAHDPIRLDLLSRHLGWRPPTTIREGVARTLAHSTGEEGHS